MLCSVTLLLQTSFIGFVVISVALALGQVLIPFFSMTPLSVTLSRLSHRHYFDRSYLIDKGKSINSFSFFWIYHFESFFRLGLGFGLELGLELGLGLGLGLG